MIEENIKVVEVVHRALQGLDQRDWSAYREAFADTMHLDYSSWRADAVGRCSADEWVERVRTGFIAGCDATQHIVTNHVVSRDTRGVQLECEMRAMHTATIDGVEDWLEIGGSYTWRFFAHRESYLVEGLRLDVRWRRGNSDLPVLTARRRQ